MLAVHIQKKRGIYTNDLDAQEKKKSKKVTGDQYIFGGAVVVLPTPRLVPGAPCMCDIAGVTHACHDTLKNLSSPPAFFRRSCLDTVCYCFGNSVFFHVVLFVENLLFKFCAVGSTKKKRSTWTLITAVFKSKKNRGN